MANITKRDIVVNISEKYKDKVSQILVKQIVQDTFDTMVDTLVKKGRLELRNFGVFTVKTRKPRKARNPKTGETVMVPERKVVSFKPGLLLLNKLK